LPLSLTVPRTASSPPLRLACHCVSLAVASRSPLRLACHCVPPAVASRPAAHLARLCVLPDRASRLLCVSPAVRLTRCVSCLMLCCCFGTAPVTARPPARDTLLPLDCHPVRVVFHLDCLSECPLACHSACLPDSLLEFLYECLYECFSWLSFRMSLII
jgi:hypothetical protein